ncbi:MAG: ParB/RepB/Spo0J family partition protein [Rikenellaceae bacterium]|jgi:ParB family chromosome partitioning protein|nr:ParB/RepB/Spo0J family partition protein [Rikenellaceae bacterium]
MADNKSKSPLAGATAKPAGKSLGRGLDAIFGTESKVQGPEKPRQTASLMEEIEISRITPNPKQPRSSFDEEALGELADSIRTLGVIQPITVNRGRDGNYIIISGERRFRASQIAGNTTIPAYVRDVDDQAMHEMALVENIQRQDLNAIDVAMSLQRLIDECNLTQDMLSSRVGKKRSTIANYMRLLNLPLEVQYAVRDELITMGHAKAIASAPAEEQVGVLRKVVKRSMSVRQAEEMVRGMGQGKKAAPERDEEFPESYTRLVEQLERLFSQEISIKKGAKGGGKIVIGFTDDRDIEKFIARFEKI